LIVSKYRQGNGTVDANLFNVGYYDDYRGQIEIRKYDDTGNVTYTCKLIDAWPKQVAPLQVEWENGDQFLIQSVQFQYWLFTDNTNNFIQEFDEDGNKIISGVK
jgi:hypothetical protein